eukprot:XP_001707137.1 Hypothetical protein GL50803_37454 [Giardia lamblia ATCC 50803]
MQWKQNTYDIGVSLCYSICQRSSTIGIFDSVLQVS